MRARRRCIHRDMYIRVKRRGELCIRGARMWKRRPDTGLPYSRRKHTHADGKTCMQMPRVEQAPHTMGVYRQPSADTDVGTLRGSTSRAYSENTHRPSVLYREARSVLSERAPSCCRPLSEEEAPPEWGKDLTLRNTDRLPLKRKTDRSTYTRTLHRLTQTAGIVLRFRKFSTTLPVPAPPVTARPSVSLPPTPGLHLTFSRHTQRKKDRKSDPPRAA